MNRTFPFIKSAVDRPYIILSEVEHARYTLIQAHKAGANKPLHTKLTVSDIVDAVEILLAPLVVHVLAFALDDLERIRLVEERARLSAKDKRGDGAFYYRAMSRTSAIDSRQRYT